MENNITAKLKSLFNYMKELQVLYGNLHQFKPEPNPVEAFELKQLQEEIETAMLKHTIKNFGYNKKPQVVSDDEYRKIKPTFQKYLGVSIKINEVYRGARNIEHHANTLCDDDYHVGVGDMCRGLHSALVYNTALSYTNTTDDNYILHFKMPNMNIADSLTLQIDISNAFFNGCVSKQNEEKLREITSFVMSIEDLNDRNDFANIFVNDLAQLAIFLGYDAVYDHNFPAYAVLNRGKMCVSESEYNRICEQSLRPNDKISLSQSVKEA